MSRAWFALAVAGVLGLFYVGAGLRGDSPANAVAFGQEQPAPQKARRSRGQPESEQVGAAQEAERTASRGRGGQVGRYQMAIRDGAGDGGRPYVVVCDTTTGRCWVASLPSVGGQNWRDLGGPGASAIRAEREPAAIEVPRLHPPAREGAAIDGDAATRLTPTPVRSIPQSDAPRAVPPPADAQPRLPARELPPPVPGARDA